MLTRFLIDVFFTGCIIGMPLAVWAVWKFGPVEVMRYLGLHSDYVPNAEPNESEENKNVN